MMAGIKYWDVMYDYRDTIYVTIYYVTIYIYIYIYVTIAALGTI
jgi:hypothetical protein